MLLVFFICLLVELYMIAIYLILYKKNKELKKIKKNWSIKHRLDKNGYLQYSVDGKLWTHIMGYDENTNYGEYTAPGFGYLKFDSENDEKYPMWCNMLNTMQKCHEWNKAALEHYREGMTHYLNK